MLCGFTLSKSPEVDQDKKTSNHTYPSSAYTPSLNPPPSPSYTPPYPHATPLSLILSSTLSLHLFRCLPLPLYHSTTPSFHLFLGLPLPLRHSTTHTFRHSLGQTFTSLVNEIRLIYYITSYREHTRDY